MTVGAVTVSERLFQAFCVSNGVSFSRVPTASDMGERRPDYQVTGHCGTTIVVEVKQFEPNSEELEAERSRMEGKVVVSGGVPGQRLREVIGRANGQLKTLARGELPGLLVVYDAVRPFRHSDPYAVLTAMRGLDVVPVEVPRDPAQSPRFLERRSGPKKQLTAAANRSISAIAVLKEIEPGPSLSVYHNKHAAVRLAVSDLEGPAISHFQMAEDEGSWIPLVPAV